MLLTKDSKYQEVFIPCVNKKNKNNVLYIFDILSSYRYQKIGEQLSRKFNFYAVNIFFDSDYHMVLGKPNIEKWCEYIAMYIKANKIDLSKTIIISQYYSCALMPTLNKILNGKIKKMIYVSPFVKFSLKTKKILLNILKKDANGVSVLYNDIDQLKNDVNWIQTSRLEDIVSQANFKDLKRIVNYFHKLFVRTQIKDHQKHLQYKLGLFLGEKDQLVNFDRIQKIFWSDKKIKLYPFFNSKLCCFEEEEYKFTDCVIDFFEQV